MGCQVSFLPGSLTTYLGDSSELLLTAQPRNVCHFWSLPRQPFGPLLFIIFINDLPDEAIGDVFTSLYADDTKVYRNINTIEHCMSIQKTLTNMDTWT